MHRSVTTRCAHSIRHRGDRDRRIVRDACEIYPDVFVVDDGSVISTYAGPANGYCPCVPVEPDVDEAFEIGESQLKSAIRWATTIYRPR